MQRFFCGYVVNWDITLLSGIITSPEEVFPMKWCSLRTLSVLAMSIFCVLTASAQDQRPHPRIITVTGTAEIKVPPDQVVLTFGIETTNQDVVMARDQNAERMKKVLALIRQAGVADKDVQTSELSMKPNLSEERTPRLLGYTVTEMITLTLKDLSKYESLMTSFLQAGVNRVDRIEFAVAEPRKYRDDARLQAIRIAREKAAAMAAELGQTIGKPWEIVEEEEPWFQQFNSSAGAQNTVSSSEESLASGLVVIRTTVRVSFQLE